MDLTYNRHGQEMLEQLADRIDEAKLKFELRAIRDLELARTHLEDALTRYNSATYRIRGTWKRADPDT